jgi:hypothetical protein
MASAHGGEGDVDIGASELIVSGHYILQYDSAEAWAQDRAFSSPALNG